MSASDVAEGPPWLGRLLAESRVVVQNRFGSVFAESDSAVLFLSRDGVVAAFVVGIVGANIGPGGLLCGAGLLATPHATELSDGAQIALGIVLILIGLMVTSLTLFVVLRAYQKHARGARSCRPILIADLRSNLLVDGKTGQPLWRLDEVLFRRTFSGHTLIADWPGNSVCVFEGSGSGRDLWSANPVTTICERLHMRGLHVQ